MPLTIYDSTVRVTTELWVSALVRRVFASGGFAAVMRRGAAEAGAVFVAVRDRTGHVTLYGPAPQTSYEAGAPDDRHFMPVAAQDTDLYIEREVRFDPDIWLVEVETAAVPDLIRIVEP